MPKYKGIQKKQLKSGVKYYSTVYYKRKKYNVPGGYKTAEEAKIARAHFLKELTEGDLTNKKKTIVSKYSEIFLEEYSAQWRSSTMLCKKSYIDQHIIPVIGNKMMKAVEPLDIQRIKKRLYQKELEISYIYAVLNFVKMFFDTAMHWGYTNRNPAFSIK